MELQIDCTLKCVFFLYFSREGGWILDGFPATKDQWAAMVEENILPDQVLFCVDGSAQAEVVKERWDGIT